MSLPLTKAALQGKIRKEATSLPVAMEAETKTRTRQLARRAVAGDLDQLDFDTLDLLGRLTGDLANTYLESISAAKITSATMLATTLTLAGTDASNNKTSLVMIGDALMRINDGTPDDRLRLSNAGMEINPANNEGAAASGIVGRGLFNTGAHWTGIWPFSNANRRGWQIRSDGVAGGLPQGNIRLVATRGSGNVATDTTAWASTEMNVEGSGVGAIAGYAGVVLRNMLWVLGPSRLAGNVDVTGFLNPQGNVKIDGHLNLGGTYQSNGTSASFGGGLTTSGAIVSGGGVTSNTGNFASPNGVVLDILGGSDAVNLRGSVVNSIPLFKATNGLTVAGALSLPTDSIDNVMLRSHATDNTRRSVGLNHIFDALRDAPQLDLSLRRIGSFWGGDAITASANNHSHSVSFKELPKSMRQKILAGRARLRSGLASRQQMPQQTTGRLAARLWLAERLLLALLHMALEDPERTAEAREAVIERKKQHDHNEERYEGGEAEYRQKHDALNFLDIEDLAS